MNKRRTNPVPLLSVTVLCFVLIGYFNSRNGGDDKTPPPQQQQPSVESNPSTQGQSKDGLSSRLNVGGAPGSGPKMPPRPGVQIQGPDGAPGPKPQMHPAKLYKAKPSDSQTSVEWWSDEANKTFK